MAISKQIRTIQRLASDLSADGLCTCVRFFHRLAEKKEREAAMADTRGIPLRSVLTSFRKLCCNSKGGVTLTEPGLGGTAMVKFYEETRVNGCPMGDAGGDMLLVQWGIDD